MKKLKNETERKKIIALKVRYKSVQSLRIIYTTGIDSFADSNDLLKSLYRGALKLEYQVGNHLKHNLCINTRPLLIKIDSTSDKYN